MIASLAQDTVIVLIIVHRPLDIIMVRGILERRFIAILTETIGRTTMAKFISMLQNERRLRALTGLDFATFMASSPRSRMQWSTI